MIEKKTLKNLYYQMLRIRFIEEEIVKKYPQQEIRCPVHLCIGQEAIPVGVCANLRLKDKVFSNHRSHGHFIAKGGDVKKMIAEMYGKLTGCSQGRGGSQHLIDLNVNFIGSTPIVGGSIPVAVGSSWTSLMKNQNTVTVVFFGDAAVEEGVLHESLNFASLKKLPILFVCENNLYSILTPIIKRQPKRDIYKIPMSHKIMAWKEDGNNVIKVYETARKALNHIRHGNGPVFIEYTTYRHKEHCGPFSEPVGLRPEKEFHSWMKKCPVNHIEKYLLEKALITQQNIKQIRQKIRKEINYAFNYARKSPYPGKKLSLNQVFA